MFRLRRTTLVAVVPLVASLLIAACGSSSKHAASAVSPRSYGQPSTSSTSTSAPAALITTKHNGKLGTILAFGPKRLTVYLFEADKGQVSNCTGGCASVWPPVTGKPQASGAAMSSELGTIKRSDGKTQVTYKGHPLYLYARDKDDGDAYGEALKQFGAEWYALKSSGDKVDLS